MGNYPTHDYINILFNFLSFIVLPYANNVLYAEKTDFSAGEKDTKKWLQA